MTLQPHIIATARTTLLACLVTAVGSCAPSPAPMNDAELSDLATRYAAAWSSQDPDRLAAFYADAGSLTVNDGDPAVGRDAVRATAESFMGAFPDMVVRMDSVVRRGPAVVFHWTWTGTNTGPGGTGAAVHLTGYEEWTLGPDGLITESLGHFDEAEYQRQLGAGAAPGT